MRTKIKRIIKYIKEEFCDHKWIDMGKRVVYNVNENNKRCSIPYTILYVRKCEKCEKVEELRMEIPNGL